MLVTLIWAVVATFTVGACGDYARLQQVQLKSTTAPVVEQTRSGDSDPKKAKKTDGAELPKTPTASPQNPSGKRMPSGNSDGAQPTTPSSRLSQNHPGNVVPNGNKDSSGVVVLTVHSDELYVLFGKERRGGHGASEKWNFMRGAVDAGQTYLASAMRELDEETAGFYKTSIEELAKAPYSTFKKGAPWNNIAYTFLVQKTYVDENLIKQKSDDLKNSGADHHLWEMTDYQWVQLNVLIKALEQSNRILSAVTSPTHSTPSMEIYDYTFGLLLKALPELKARWANQNQSELRGII